MDVIKSADYIIDLGPEGGMGGGGKVVAIGTPEEVAKEVLYRTGFEKCCEIIEFQILP